MSEKKIKRLIEEFFDVTKVFELSDTSSMQLQL